MCANSQNSHAPMPAKRSAPSTRHGEIDDRRLAADRGEVAVVAVAERRASARRAAGAAGWPRRLRPICLAAGLTPGTGVGAPRPWLMRGGQVADDRDLGVAGDASGRARRRTRPARSSVGAGAARQRLARAARRRRRRPRSRSVQASRCAACRRVPLRSRRPRRRCRSPSQPVRTSTPAAASCSRARCDSARHERAEHARRRLRAARRAHARESMWRNSRRSVCCAISLIVPAISTPVGPAPMTTKVSQASRGRGVAARARRARRRRSRGRGCRRRRPASSAPARARPSRRGRSSCAWRRRRRSGGRRRAPRRRRASTRRAGDVDARCTSALQDRQVAALHLRGAARGGSAR